MQPRTDAIGIEEVRLEVCRANAVVAPARGTQVVPTLRLAEFLSARRVGPIGIH